MSNNTNQELETSFIIEKILDAPQELVWKAISDKDYMKEWYFELPDFEPELGCTFKFIGGPPDGKQWVHLCEIKEVVPGSKLAYSWKYEGYPGDSLVTFELTALDEVKTKLRLTHAGLHTFPVTESDLREENFKTGWTEIIGTSLPEFLSKHRI